uniref:Uncharacterized protein n=1 Tax=Panagrolaimus sp. ES5 TaxID=591445 RepID=A0AC34FN06_9BILA
MGAFPFTCDCFIRGNNGNSLDELLRSLSFETNVTTTPKFHPKLFVVHPNRDTKPTMPPIVTPPLEIQQPIKQKDNFLNTLISLIKESQQKLQELGWIQADQDIPKPTIMQPAVVQVAEEESPNLFSIEQGSITRNIVRIGRFLQFADKFDCRCAGDLSSLVNAKRFVRFTVAHA